MTQKIWLFPNIYDNASLTLSGSQNALKMGFTFILIKLKRLKKLFILPNTHKCSEGLSNFIGITKKPDRSVSVYINFRFWFLVLCHSSAWDKWMKTISMNLRFLFNKVLFLNFWHLMRNIHEKHAYTCIPRVYKEEPNQMKICKQWSTNHELTYLDNCLKNKVKQKLIKH